MALAKIALCQLDLVWENVSENYKKAKASVKFADTQGADLIIFPETCLSGFTMHPDRAALTWPDEKILQLSAETESTLVMGAAMRVEAPNQTTHYENQCLVLRKGDLLGRYSKNYLFRFGGETKAYKPGKERFQFTHGTIRLTPVICYDLRFPELFTSLAPSTDAFIVIANWPKARIEHWKTLLRARALDTQAYCIGVNRVGEGNSIEYPGHSMVFDPQGELIFDGKSKEGVFPVELEFNRVTEWREKFPLLKDRHE